MISKNSLQRYESITSRLSIFSVIGGLFFISAIILIVFFEAQIERNLKQKALQSIVQLSELDQEFLLSKSLDTTTKISNYGMTSDDIGLIRIYDSKNQRVVSEYTKPGFLTHAAFTNQATFSPGVFLHVERVMGLAQSVHAISVLKSNVQTVPSESQFSAQRLAEVALDFTPHRIIMYPILLTALTILSLIFWSAAFFLKRQITKSRATISNEYTEIQSSPLLNTTHNPVGNEKAPKLDADLLVQTEKSNKTVWLANQENLQETDMNRDRESLLASFSHEIHTPVNGIVGMLALLLDTNLTTTQREFASMAATSAENLVSRLGEMLDLHSLSSGKLGLEHCAFNLSQELQSIYDKSQAKIKEKGLTFILDKPLHIPYQLIGNRVRIHQIISSLLDNAIQFTSTGTITLKTKIDEHPDYANIEISVIDTGKGIAETKITEITQAPKNFLYQKFDICEENPLKLFMCHRLIEIMNGTLHIQSTVGHGSVFSIHLKLTKAPNAKALIKEDVLTGMRVLLVEENTEDRNTHIEHLSQLGLHVRGVDTGIAALGALEEAMVKQAPYHIAILNHKMRGVDGEVLGNALKTDPMYRDTILVLISNQIKEIHAKKIEQAGFSALLIKPVALPLLIDTLRCLCSDIKQGKIPHFITASSTVAIRQLSDDVVRPFENYRILVADDNIVNQQVAMNMLQKLGCKTDAADNGQQAITMHMYEPYDLILMDCQMPILDGYQATSNLRSLETNRHTPIIALTAFTLHGERKRCLAAGMDDFIAKPILPRTLKDTISRWLIPRLASPLIQESSPRKNELAEMQEMFGDDFASLANLYQSDSPQRIAGMHAAATTRDLVQLAKVVHSLGGSSASIGATNLATLCKSFEMRLKEGLTENLEQHIAEIQQEYINIDAQLRSMVMTVTTTQ